MNQPQINLVVYLNPTRLNAKLPPLAAAQLHSSVVLLRSVPNDVSSIVLRVFKPDLTSHFDIVANRRPDGSAIAYVIGTCFPTAGNAKYEIHAYDFKGNATALGFGDVSISAFSTSAAAVSPGQSVPIMQIADSSGALHTITAVYNGSEWTSVVE